MSDGYYVEANKALEKAVADSEEVVRLRREVALAGGEAVTEAEVVANGWCPKPDCQCDAALHVKPNLPVGTEADFAPAMPRVWLVRGMDDAITAHATREGALTAMALRTLADASQDFDWQEVELLP